MVDLDLDIIAERTKTIKIGGKEVVLKNITMEEHMEAELIVQQLEATQLVNKKSIKDASKLKDEYIMKILDVSPEEAKKITLKQYQALRKFISRQELYDQGMTDRDIDLMEKKVLKKQMAQIQ